MDLYTHKIKLAGSEDFISLEKYRNKVLLIVNVASHCGFTGQYEELQSLYLKYKDQGLEIFAFPCNQFANQEPGTDEDIKKFCSINYNISFPVFSKIDVNGENTHPLFQLLKNKAPGTFGKGIKWNFTKFLVGKNAEMIRRYAPATKPSSIEKQIVKLLNK